MRSDRIDQLLTRYVKQPVKLSWSGSLTDALLGSFEGARLELAGVATAWLPLQRVVLEAERVKLTPGLPARLRVEVPRVELSVGQLDVDLWLSRFDLPFRLELAEKGLVVHTEIAGFPVGEFETSLDVVRGWFVLRPRRASFLGVPGYVSSLFRTYLPLPPLPEQTRLVAIGHEPEGINLTLEIDDIDEAVTPGLLDRLRRQILPFAS